MRYRRAVRAALRLVLMLSVVSVGSAALVACNPACAAADEKEPSNWGEWFRTDHSARQAGEKKPGQVVPEGGVPAKGGGIPGGSKAKGKNQQKCGGSKAAGGNYWGSKARNFPSITVYNAKVGKYRFHVDVENPGKRDASIHLQIKEPGSWGKYKFEWNRFTRSFQADRKTGKAMPNKIRDHMNTDKGKAAVNKALRNLGEG